MMLSNGMWNQEFSYTTGVELNCYNHFGEEFLLLELKVTIYNPEISLLCIYHGKTLNWKENFN